MAFFEDAKLRVQADFQHWKEKRAEKAEAKKAAKPQDPPYVTTPLWLVRACKFAAWVATIALMYFLWLYTLDIARDRSAALQITHAGMWIGDLQFWFPHIIGFAVVAFGIPYVAKIAIPTFVSLSWHQDATAKVWSLFIAVAVSIVVIAGTFTVQGHNIMERDRDAAVAVEQVQTERAVLESRIVAREAELRSMMENRNAYLAQAASVGAVEWERSYIAQTAANDPQRERIVRALGAARAADAVRADLSNLREQAARGTAVSAVQGEIVTERTDWIADTLGWLEGVRAILLSFVMDIVALIMPLIALRLEQARNRQMGIEASGWAPEGLRIEDLRHEPVRETEPLTPMKRRYTDADTGDEIEESYVRAHKRERKIKRGEKTKVHIQPDIPPDEQGVKDGGNRTASVTIAGLMESAKADAVAEDIEADALAASEPVQNNAPADVVANEEGAEQHNDQRDLETKQLDSSDELPVFEDETSTETQDPEPAESVQENNAEPDQEREPETDPSRLIAAE